MSSQAYRVLTSKLDPIKVLKVTLFMMKLVLGPLSFVIGIRTLRTVSTGAYGFKFLGTIALVISILTLILFCVDCLTIDDKEQVFFAESLCCGVPLYLLMTSLGLFALVVTWQGGGKSLPWLAYKEYELSSYSKWLQNQVNDTYRWDKYYKPRLVKYHVCSDMVSKFRLDSLEKFHRRELNSFESGCCKPSEECEFDYISPTSWSNPEKHNNTNLNADCYTWSNDPNTLCFNCRSCKAGFAEEVRRQWEYARILGGVLAFKLILFMIAIALIIRRICTD